MLVRISIATNKPDADTVQRLIRAATSNCRCAKFVECDMNSPRPGCARAERLAARQELNRLGIGQYEL